MIYRYLLFCKIADFPKQKVSIARWQGNLQSKNYGDIKETYTTIYIYIHYIYKHWRYPKLQIMAMNNYGEDDQPVDLGLFVD